MQEEKENIRDEDKKAESKAAEDKRCGKGSQAEQHAKEPKKEVETLKKELEGLKKECEKTKAELDARNDSYLRIAAEYDNYRKRTTAEKAAIHADAYASAAELFLPMADALERALELEPEDKGIALLKKQLSDIFSKLGITEIESDGKEFDPALHNAVMHEEDESKPSNTVVQTFQRGYMLGEKIIRHAMEKVVN